ncbi:MAG: two-component system response regulator, partial [Deltaproteobacteria bacterium]|nr:two-component system response regulator [Deltaproteobacteria bacterium]
FSQKNRKDIKGFSPHAMDQMLRYGWPGNVRELMNAVERAVVMSRSEYIQPEDLPLELQNLPPENAVDPSLKIPDEGVSLEKMEKETILKTLASTSGNKSEAARRLGITRKTLRKKLKNYEVQG